MRLRPLVRPDEVPAVAGLVEELTTLEGHSPVGEHKFLDLLGAGSERIMGMVFEGDDGSLAAYVAANPDEDLWTVEFAIRPEHRTRIGQLLDEVVTWISEAGGRRVRIWAYRDDLAASLADAGFSVERDLHQLRRRLPAGPQISLPAPLEVRGFRVGDEAAWLEVNARAFEGHPENGNWDAEILANRTAQSWFDAEALLMLWDGQTLVGFCWSKPVDERTGEIYGIAVDPDRQGEGLGRFLLLEGLDVIRTRFGADEALLYVDSTNSRALALYSSLGFGLDHIDRAFTMNVG